MDTENAENVAIKKYAAILLRVVIVCAGLAGIIHFDHSFVKWHELLPIQSGWRTASNIHKNWYIDALPCAILFVASACLIIAGYNNKRVGGLMLLLWSVISTSIFFWYDVSNQNWQVKTFTPMFGRRCYYGNWPHYKIGPDNERWGYIDESGKFVIKPQFENASQFSEGLAAVEIENMWRYIDRSGKFASQRRFSQAGSFQNNIAIVRFAGNLDGLIDKNFKFICEPKHQIISPFSEGLASVGPVFDEEDIENFMQNPPKEGDTETIFDKGKYGYINELGKLVIDIKFQEAGDFSDGRAIAIIDGKSVLIDKKGQLVSHLSHRIFGFSEGLGRFRSNGRHGYCDLEGKVAIEPQFDFARHFSEGLACVTDDNYRWGCINKTGKFVIEPQYDYISHFSNGLAVAFTENEMLWIDKAGQVMSRSKRRHCWIGDFKEEMATASNTRRYGYINKNGETVIALKYYHAREFSEGLAAVSILKGSIPFWATYGTVIGLGLVLAGVSHKLKLRDCQKHGQKNT